MERIGRRKKEFRGKMKKIEKMKEVEGMIWRKMKEEIQGILRNGQESGREEKRTSW